MLCIISDFDHRGSGFLMDIHPSKWIQSIVFLALFYWPSKVKGNVWWPCRSECARCLRETTPWEDLLIQYYPGLFSPTPPENNRKWASGQSRFGANNILYSKSAQARVIDPNWAPQRSKGYGLDNSTLFPAMGNNSIINTDNKAIRNKTKARTILFHDNIRHPPQVDSPMVLSGAAGKLYPKTAPQVQCCQTVQEYVIPPNVTVEGKVYRVVHLREAFQFIPVAKCREDSTCGHGECVERYRAHWVLVYNSTKTRGEPPVSFTPIEVPSYCECLNVGKP